MNVDHLPALTDLRGPALADFVSMLASWFVSHDSLDRTRLMSLVAEAEANAS